MAKKEISLSHLLLFLLCSTLCAAIWQSNSESDKKTFESAHAWPALPRENELPGVSLMQLNVLKKFGAVNQELPLQKISTLHQRSAQIHSLPPGYLPPETEMDPVTATSSLCGHSLSGVDDEAVFTNLAHKGIPGTSTNAHTSSQVKMLQQQKIFIAVCLHESAEILPYWTMELVRLLMALSIKSNSTNLFVSVYESGSLDGTVKYLNMLEEHLKFIGVPHKIVTGGVTRKPGRQRIDFLAAMRNKALKPLRASTQPFDNVLWLSDNLFCADGVLQMLAHALPEAKGGLGADAVCGMDYTWGDYVEVFDRCLFYDRWASHDITGTNFGNEEPVINVGPDNSKLEAGQPFQVFSCWNAMVVFSADVFQKNIISFRRNREQLGECAVAETELIFRDMWKVGRGKIVISPRAASAYHVHDFGICAAKKQPTQFDTAATITWKPAPDTVTCCQLPPGSDSLDDWASCFRERWNRFDAPGTMSNRSSSLSLAVNHPLVG